MMEYKAAIVIEKGHQMLMMPDGQFIPFQLMSRVEDSIEGEPTALIKVLVNIFPTKAEALKFYSDK